MRFAAYAGASTALAAAVVLRAFHQRPNFFSASVYLAQSQACRMILLNLALLCVYSVVRALQKLLYGPLRPIEREQLWDRSWYAVTETALAMTIFRDEVGIFFMFMFVTLLVGKIWCWISEGRVEVFEQQPPSNPRLFHTRLVASLVLSELFDLGMLQYCVQTVVDHPRRPGMMVMFAFEFAVLLVSSTSTTARYLLSLQESLIVKKQTAARLEERREEIRSARREADRLVDIGASQEDIRATIANLPREEDVDENDIDVPGWQEKGRWVLLLDLFTDLFKLVIYVMFFTMLLLFHGIPIHIIRDVYVTARSFIKRINDFNKYRNATRDMNARYADATAEELQRDGTCIICREDMRPWRQEPNNPPDQAAGHARPNRLPPDERQRPKKLPCGHILHLGCLKSWLERQQVCPTCRTSVLVSNATPRVTRQNLPPHLQQAVENAQRRQQGGPGEQGQQPAQQGQQGGNENQPNVPAGGNNLNGQGNQPANQNDRNEGDQNAGGRARTFALGPFRFTFAAGNANEVRNLLERPEEQGQAQGQGMGQQQGPQQNAAGVPPLAGGNGRFSGLLRRMGFTRAANEVENPVEASMTAVTDIQRLLVQMEQGIVNTLARMRLTQQQLSTVRALQEELARLRSLQINPHGPEQFLNQQRQQNRQRQQHQHQPQPMQTQGHAQQPAAFPGPNLPLGTPGAGQARTVLHQMVFSGNTAQTQGLGPGHPNLPEGLVLPEGYTLLPLQRQNPNGPEHAMPVSSDDEDLSVDEVTEQFTSSVVTHADSNSSSSTNTDPQEQAPPPTRTVGTSNADVESHDDSSLLPNWSQPGPEDQTVSASSQTTSEDTSQTLMANGAAAAAASSSLSDAVNSEPGPSDDQSMQEANDRDKRKQPSVEDAEDHE